MRCIAQLESVGADVFVVVLDSVGAVTVTDVARTRLDGFITRAKTCLLATPEINCIKIDS